MAWARWTVLAIVSFTMMAGYVVAKEMSPLQFMLEKAVQDGGMGWTSGEFGIFAGSRGFFNVFLLMLFVGGVILDKMGVRSRPDVERAPAGYRQAPSGVGGTGIRLLRHRL